VAAEAEAPGLRVRLRRVAPGYYFDADRLVEVVRLELRGDPWVIRRPGHLDKVVQDLDGAIGFLANTPGQIATLEVGPLEGPPRRGDR